MMTISDMDPASGAGKPLVVAHDGRAETNSQNVAGCFDRRHADVIRAIRALLKAEPTLSQRNFALAEYIDGQGKNRPTYDMDKDGFTLIAMGFTGPKAFKFKLAYIAEFNRMEAALNAPPANDDAPNPHREFPDWPLDELRAKRAVIDMYRMTFGPRSAQWMLPQLGFPLPPLDFVEMGQQLRLALDGLPPCSGQRGAA
jgi:Rha family phage regulatory protein